ncbi:MAG: low molecular weight phosphatase family protein [Candidatus Paceibacterota bacterium]
MKIILFACTENKKRSKMAEAIFNHFAKGKETSVQAISAGTIPATETDSHVAAILAKHHIDFKEEAPKKLSDEMLEHADRIISFGCLIPDMFPKEKFEEWLVEDPQTEEEYEKAYVTIYEKVTDLFSAISNS